jgi:hypothetical protein
MITTWQRELNYAELENRKGAIPQYFEESPLELGIIRYTAQYPLCRARHKGYFQDDVPMNTPSAASSAAFCFSLARSNGMLESHPFPSPFQLNFGFSYAANTRHPQPVRQTRGTAHKDHTSSGPWLKRNRQESFIQVWSGRGMGLWKMSFSLMLMEVGKRM